MDHSRMYGSVDYEPWAPHSMEPADHMYSTYPLVHPVAEKYPPEATVRADQYGEQSGPASECWPGLDLSGHKLVSLSPNIGNFKHITSLYLLNNCLTRLPPTLFTGLVNLTYLDACNNNLTQLPPEIENAQQLKQLKLTNNKLTVLPFEMGRLWRLEELSIDQSRITSPAAHIVQKGTRSIISYLRDNMKENAPVAPRKWIAAPVEQKLGPHRFKVLTYNILAESYATEEQHPYVASHILQWENRKHKILEELLQSQADIICLQEVESDQFNYFFLPKLKEHGYDGIQKLKTRAKTMRDPGFVDGCSIFFSTSKFSLEKRYEIEYQSLAYKIPTGAGLDRTIRRDNVALFAILRTLPDPSSSHSTRSPHNRRILVCNTHVHWDPTEADVKLMQAQFMMDEIDRVSKELKEPNIPLIIAGDFNSEPSNAVYTLMDTGKVNPDHKDWNNINYGEFSKLGSKHRFHLRNCFQDLVKPETLFTNFNGDFMGVLDYIWVSSDSIRVIGVSCPPTRQEIKDQNSPLPNENYPSDHIFLLTEVEILSNHKKRGN